MLITKLVLFKYKRLLLNRVNYFEITPTTTYQLIIGTNGSGKTSVMRELSPMPAHAADYHKDGYKIIEFTHRGQSYVLSSTFINGPHHTFEMNGESLNQGGTATVQKELIWRHLGMDNEILSLMLDETKLTNMTSTQRRDVLMRLSGGNLDYAMQLYNQLRSKLRDMQGYVKHLSKRLSDEANQIPSHDDIQALDVQCQQVKQELTALMEHRTPNTPIVSAMEQALGRRLKTIEATASSILGRLQHRAEDLRIASMDDLEHEIEVLQQTITMEQTKINVYHQEYDKISALVDAMRKANVEGLRDIETRRATTMDRYRVMLASLNGYAPIDNPAECLARLRAIEGSIEEIFATIPTNHDGRYNRETELRLRDSITALQRKIDSDSERALRLRHRMEHIAKAERINCPRCKYSWLDGIADGEAVTLQDQAEQINAVINADRRTLKEQTTELEAALDYAVYVRRMGAIMDSNPMLERLWKRVLEAWNHGRSPTAVASAIARWKDQLMISMEIAQIQSEVDDIDAAYRHAETNGVESAGYYIERVAELETILVVHTRSLMAFQTTLRSAQQYRNHVRKALEEEATLQTEIESFYADLERMINSVRNDRIATQIGERHTALARMEESLGRARTARALIEELEHSKREALLDIDAVALLVNELSPTGGIIADQLFGFLECLTDQMNLILNQIWTYDFRVLPTSEKNKDGELDYRFPMRINGSDQLVRDVAGGSASQVDGVNWAFKLVAMMYLGLEDWPLYLDELAPSLDEQHRLNIVMFVKMFVESRRCSQMWMISHYAVQSGAFQPSQTCVMDTANIVTLPESYNQHVVMR